MELKDALKLKDKIIIGKDRTLKAINASKIKEIFISSNYPLDELSNLENSSEIREFVLNKLEINSEELGARCRRPHPVIIVGLLK